MTWVTPKEVAHAVRLEVESVWRNCRRGRYRCKNASARSERPTYRIAVDEDGFPIPNPENKK